MLIAPMAIKSAEPLSMSASRLAMSAPGRFIHKHAGPEFAEFLHQGFVSGMQHMQVGEVELGQFADERFVHLGRVRLRDVIEGVGGEMRMPVRPGPISCAMAVATSTAKRMRFSTDPPY